VRIGDVPIDIPAGTRDYVVRDQWTLPVAVELVSLFPHAHYLAQRLRVWARLPDGSERPLLGIDDWDPAWQDEYVLATPLALPAGSTLAMEFHYDNSDGNARNPQRPPVRVLTGERTVDEMGNVTMVVKLASARDKVTLREAKYRRQLAAGGGPRVEYNLANTLMAEGRVAEAIASYRRALGRDDTLLPAHVNLGAALLAGGDVAGARAELEAAARRWPQSATAQANLGRVLVAAGKKAEAAAALKRALAIDPSLAPARAALQALEGGR
jgi:tetratricopeptide (TPR) repeat protein